MPANTLFERMAVKASKLVVASARKTDEAVHFVNTKGVACACLGVALAASKAEILARELKTKSAAVGMIHAIGWGKEF